MRKFQTLRDRGALCAWLLVALAAGALCAGAAAQSGRRRTPPQSPATSQPSPEATPEGESESESRPRPADSKAGALVSFVVMGQEEAAFGPDTITMGEVIESFTRRLGSSASVSVTRAERGTRAEARERAKNESVAFVVLVGVEDEYGAGGQLPRGRRQDQNRSLVVRTLVFEPKTAAIKYMDTTYQRPVRRTVGVGGIGLPIPSGSIGRYPSQLELRQAAEDAADRILARFRIATPPNQP